MLPHKSEVQRDDFEFRGRISEHLTLSQDILEVINFDAENIFKLCCKVWLSREGAGAASTPSPIVAAPDLHQRMATWRTFSHQGVLRRVWQDATK